MKSIIKEITLKPEEKETLSGIFHKRTKNNKIISLSPKKIPEDWVKIHFKTYPRFENIKLKTSNMEQKIKDIFIKRRSVRTFSSKAINFSDMSNILFYSAGLIESASNLENSRRPYPSAGARYPLEIYVLSINIQNLRKGVYHYNVRDNVLELLIEDEDISRNYREIIGNDTSLGNASCAMVITGVLDRNRVKYKDRGYRYIALEVGHLAQNVLLLTSFMNLGACPIGGFIDDKIDNLLDIENQKEVSLYMLALGVIK